MKIVLILALKIQVQLMVYTQFYNILLKIYEINLKFLSYKFCLLSLSPFDHALPFPPLI